MTETIDPATVSALALALKKEFSNYVILHAISDPHRVARFFLDQEIGRDPLLEAVMVENLKKATFWKPSQVAEILLSASLLSPDWADQEEVVRSLDAVADADVMFSLEPHKLVGSEHPDFEFVAAENDDPFADLDPEQTFGAKDAAALLGRSYGYVKDHGEELGGIKTARGAWQFTARALAMAWPIHKG